MVNSRDANIIIAALIRSAINLLDKADSIHGQPLFYDSNGNYVDVIAVLQNTAEAAEKNFDGQ